MQIIRCVLSGSFRKNASSLEQEYRELIMCGCQVLSPHRLDFVNQDQDFVKDRAELNIDTVSLEQHHLLSIKQSDFVWLHCPDGYLGLSGALEIGYAIALGIPIYSKTKPSEELFNNFIKVTGSVFLAIEDLNY